MHKRMAGATLADVASRAGVSLKTASRVLNNVPVAPETAKKVRAAMARLDYKPNELARGLKGRRSAAIGMVVPNLADPFHAAAMQAAQEIAHKNKYVVIITGSGGDAEAERSQLESLVGRQVDGLILAPSDNRINTVECFLSANIPVVVFDRPVNGADTDSILVRNRDAVREATEHLISHGYRRILAIGSRTNLYTGSERVAGYATTMARARLKEETLLVDNETELTTGWIEKALESGPGKVDAILTLNGTTTMAVLRILRQLGRTVGPDIALISFDDFELAEVLTPRLTVVRQPAAELGRLAAERLFARILGERTTPCQHITLQTTFLIRESCGCKER
jgi:LacI family transcriptional regulator